MMKHDRRSSAGEPLVVLCVGYAVDWVIWTDDETYQSAAEAD